VARCGTIAFVGGNVNQPDNASELPTISDPYRVLSAPLQELVSAVVTLQTSLANERSIYRASMERLREEQAIVVEGLNVQIANLRSDLARAQRELQMERDRDDD